MEYSAYVSILDVKSHLQSLIVSDYNKCLWFKQWFGLNTGAEQTTAYRKQMRDYSHVTYRLSAYAELYNFITHSDFDWTYYLRNKITPFSDYLPF